jgi:glycosyltransferase involved in cell wall biosynthesis
LKGTVSIIIPTYNRCELLRKTIDSFLKINYPVDLLEVIIADNNSTDSTRNMVSEIKEKSKFPIIYHLEEQQGVHYARNSAAKIAKGEFLYYTDDDMIADEDLLCELLKVISMDAQIGTATGRVLPKWETTPPEWVKKYMCNAKLSLNNPEEELIISKSDCKVFSCHQIIRREAFFKAGGYNPENTKGLWIGDGETGLNIKLQKLGYKFAYAGKSIIWHFIPRMRMTQKYLILRLINQANSDSFTYYRRESPTPQMLIRQIFFRVLKLPHRVYLLIESFILLKDSWRLKLAAICYHLIRIRNEFSFFISKEKRTIATKDNWLDIPSS